MSEFEKAERVPGEISRRTIVKGAAWATPVIAAAVATPLAAASPVSNALLDIDAGCVQVAGASLFPGFTVKNVGTDPYTGDVTVIETIDLSAIELDGILTGNINNRGAASSAARDALWLLLLIEDIASGSAPGVSAGNWTVAQQGPTIPIFGGRYAPFSYSRVVTISGPVAAGGSKYWGNLLDIAGILNVLDGFGIGAELVKRSAAITAPVGNPPVVDAGPATLDWSLIGGC